MTHTLALTTDSSPRPETDEDDLVRAAASGDDEAFGHLYTAYFPPLYRYLRTRTTTPEDAADVTQQVFVRAYTSIRQSGGRPGAFAPWLFRIASNAAIDSHRRRRRFIPWQDISESMLPPAPGRSPEDAVLASEQLTRLYEAVARFDPAKQELLALRFAAGLSSRQIAAVVGKSESAVKKQLTRTLRSLKEEYDAEHSPQTR